jgi:hypothetical protein
VSIFTPMARRIPSQIRKDCLALTVDLVCATMLSASVLISGCAGFAGTTTSQPPNPTYAISGAISPSTGGAGSTVALSGPTNATTTANGSGAYSFTGLSNGTYVVTPSHSGYAFAPGIQSVTVNGANVAGVNFTATAQPPQTYSISGTISPVAGGSGATVTLTGASSATTTANASGAYTFTGLANGSYTVTPSNTGYTFAPASQNVTVNGANLTGVNFAASAQGTFSISGTVSPAAKGSGAALTLSGAASATATADSSGNYAFGGLPNGAYTITATYPTSTSITYKFAPASQNVTVNGSNVTGVNFSVSLYFGTEPSHATYIPRSDSYCASAITPNSWEPRPDNAVANSTVFPSSTFNWASIENYWSKWTSKRAQVTGNFKGTTTEIIQWAACKWGVDEDTIRADAVQESYWHQNTIGDVCGPTGEGSYGLNQTKNADCSGALVHGGFPDTMNSTALAVDWFGAHTRSCYDGDFYDGGQWLYQGQTVDQIAAANGWPYVFWACVGFNFSGNWNPGQQYQLQVQQHLANRTWEQPGF